MGIGPLQNPFLLPGSAPALNSYEIDVMHGYDVAHGEDFRLDEAGNHKADAGEPYIGSLPLECIAKCGDDPSCHGACLWGGVGE